MTLPATPQTEALQRALKERGTLRRLYNVQRKAAIQRELARFTHGEELKGLVRMASKLAPTEGKRLVDAVKRADWLLRAHRDFRYLALSLLSRTIIARRERAGLVPLDDPIGEGKTNAFFMIRELLKLEGNS